MDTGCLLRTHQEKAPFRSEAPRDSRRLGCSAPDSRLPPSPAPPVLPRVLRDLRPPLPPAILGLFPVSACVFDLDGIYCADERHRRTFELPASCIRSRGDLHGHRLGLPALVHDDSGILGFPRPRKGAQGFAPLRLPFEKNGRANSMRITCFGAFVLCSLFGYVRSAFRPHDTRYIEKIFRAPPYDYILSYSIGTRSTKAWPRETVAFFIFQADLRPSYLLRHRRHFCTATSPSAARLLSSTTDNAALSTPPPLSMRLYRCADAARCYECAPCMND